MCLNLRNLRKKNMLDICKPECDSHGTKTLFVIFLSQLEMQHSILSSTVKPTICSTKQNYHQPSSLVISPSLNWNWNLKATAWLFLHKLVMQLMLVIPVKNTILSRTGKCPFICKKRSSIFLFRIKFTIYHKMSLH